MVGLILKLLSKNKNIKKKVEAFADEKIKDYEANGGLRGRLIGMMTNLVIFLETLPLFLSLLINGIILTILALIVVALFTFTSFIINSMPLEIFQDNTLPNGGGSGTSISSGGYLAWTDEELAKYGGALSEYEKNLYRMGIFAKKAIEGYDGKKQLAIDDVNAAILGVIGVASTESSMEFYTNGAMHDISKIPSDKPLNYAGYGFLGLNSNPLESYYSSDYANKVRAAYSPQGGYSYEGQYAPWGVAMTVEHLNEKYMAYIAARDSATGKTALDKIDASFDAWGIKANREKAKTVIAMCLIQAQYHGAYIEDHQAYIDFLCAMYMATSDKDEERSFDKWTIEGDSYAEAPVRLQVMGSTPYESLGYNSTPANLPPSSSTTSVLKLNGTALSKPLWSFLWDKYGTDPKFINCWDTVKKFRGGSDAYAVMSLNFHYGINSYLQGLKIMNTLAAKMNIDLNAKDPNADNSTGGSSTGNKIIDIAVEYLGAPYLLGGYYDSSGGYGNGTKIIKPSTYEKPPEGSPPGTIGKITVGQFTGYQDCSFYTYSVFARMGYDLRVPYAQTQFDDTRGEFISSISDLKVGDLVFFAMNGGGIDHVGIYMGNRLFIHASWEGAVMHSQPNVTCTIISDIGTWDWGTLFRGGRRHNLG